MARSASRARGGRSSAARASSCVDAGEPGAWNVAAGMLAPVSEAEFGERELLELGLESARRYADFCAELEDPGYRATGTMVVARDRDEAEALDRLAAFRARARPAGRAAAPVAGAAPGAGAGADDPARARHRGRPLDRPAQARRRAARARSPASSAAARVAALRVEGERGRPASSSPTARTISAGAVVVAAGVHVAQPRRCPTPRASRSARSRARCCGCATRAGPAWSSARSAASTPTSSRAATARYVLGATMEERGWDTTPTAGGVYELLRDLSELVPGVFELEIEELDRGSAARDARQPARDRPRRARRAVWATGHYRNGILLTPSRPTSSAGALAGEPVPDLAAAGRPAALRRSARMKVMLNGETAELRRRRDGRDRAWTSLDLPAAGRGVAVAVDAEVVPRGQWDAHGTARGGAGGDPARDPGRLRWPSPTRTPTS